MATSRSKASAFSGVIRDRSRTCWDGRDSSQAVEIRNWPIFVSWRLGWCEHFELPCKSRVRAGGAGANLDTVRPLRVEATVAESPMHAVPSLSQPAPVQAVGAPTSARLTPQDVEAIARRVAELVTPRG